MNASSKRLVCACSSKRTTSCRAVTSTRSCNSRVSITSIRSVSLLRTRSPVKRCVAKPGIATSTL